jgi:peroxiredoxin
MREKFYRSTDPKTVENYELGIDEIRRSGVNERVLKAEVPAPGFALPDMSGDTVRLAELLKSGPVIIVWYLGGWNPFCTVQLREMQAYYAYIRNLGASLVAISPQIPDSARSMSERNGLEFPLLYDRGNMVAREYGLVYKLPKKLARELGKTASLAEYYGNKSKELPVSMTYVVDPNGIIKYFFGEADYRMRAEPHELLDVIEQYRPGT